MVFAAMPREPSHTRSWQVLMIPITQTCDGRGTHRFRLNAPFYIEPCLNSARGEVLRWNPSLGQGKPARKSVIEITSKCDSPSGGLHFL